MQNEAAETNEIKTDHLIPKDYSPVEWTGELEQYIKDLELRRHEQMVAAKHRTAGKGRVKHLVTRGGKELRRMTHTLIVKVQDELTYLIQKHNQTLDRVIAVVAVKYNVDEISVARVARNVWPLYKLVMAERLDRAAELAAVTKDLATSIADGADEAAKAAPEVPAIRFET